MEIFISYSYVVAVLFLNILWNNIVISADCGGPVTVAASTTGVLSSPNYPNAYPNETFCIWFLEAAKDYKVSLTVTDLVGQFSGSECVDYLEVRHGSRTSGLLLKSCNSTGVTTVESEGRWMWVHFRSDSVTTFKGFTATWISTGPLISNITCPVAECKNFKFTCTNKECVSQSYRCDGVNDCGCVTDCDEDGCGGFDMSTGVITAIGLSGGITIFAIMFIIVMLTEKRHQIFQDRKREEGKKLEAQQSKRRR